MKQTRVVKIPGQKGTRETQLLKDYVLEVMWELELCLKIEKKDPPNNVVGMEANYTVLQHSLIADITAMYMLMWMAALSTGGNASVSTTTTTVAPVQFLKKAKAGSAEVEFEQMKTSGSAGFITDLPKLLDFFKKRAIGKAWQMGCKIEICDDCSMSVSCGCSDNAGLPIIVADSSCKC